MSSYEDLLNDYFSNDPNVPIQFDSPDDAVTTNLIIQDFTRDQKVEIRHRIDNRKRQLADDIVDMMRYRLSPVEFRIQMNDLRSELANLEKLTFGNDSV